MPSVLDANTIYEAQMRKDVTENHELATLLLALQSLIIDGHTLLCDISTGLLRPYIPKTFAEQPSTSSTHQRTPAADSLPRRWEKNSYGQDWRDTLWSGHGSDSMPKRQDPRQTTSDKHRGPRQKVQPHTSGYPDNTSCRRLQVLFNNNWSLYSLAAGHPAAELHSRSSLQRSLQALDRPLRHASYDHDRLRTAVRVGSLCRTGAADRCR